MFTTHNLDILPASLYLPTFPLPLQEVWGGAPEAALLSALRWLHCRLKGGLNSSLPFAQCTSSSIRRAKHWPRGLLPAEFAGRSLGCSPGPLWLPQNGQSGSHALTPSAGNRHINRLTWLYPFSLPGSPLCRPQSHTCSVRVRRFFFF